MKNDFRKNGKMAVRFETAAERREIIRILEKVFNERCGFSVSVAIDYVPKKEKKRSSAWKPDPAPVLSAMAPEETAASAERRRSATSVSPVSASPGR